MTTTAGAPVLEGLRVGHDTDPVHRTGVTVLAFDRPARAACEVRGSAPGTRETDLLAVTALVQEVHALVFAGGSAFGLAAAHGVMESLARQGVGFPTPGGVVPIVPAAVIYDLTVGDPVAPDAAAGARALAAATPVDWERGRVGAGTGATVHKIRGPAHARPGGFGQASTRLVDGTRILALSVVNAFGDVLTGEAGVFGSGADPLAAEGPPPDPFTNTTLTVVLTDARLERPALLKVAQMAHDGMARALEPAHTMYDGDVVFAVSLGERPSGIDLGFVGAHAARQVRDSIRDAVR